MASRNPEQLSLFDDPALFESADLEFKAAQGGVPKSMWESYSAFANSSGGRILLGIEEIGQGRVRVVGVGDPDKMVSEIRSVANNKGKVSINLLGDRDVYVEDFSGKHVVVVNVNRPGIAGGHSS